MKKEGRSWRKITVQVIALGGVLITAACIVLYTPWLHLLDLREVSILGNRHAGAEEIVSLSGLTSGRSLLAVSPRRIADRVLDHRWIKSVHVTRDFPHGLVIRVTEREAIARALSPTGDECSLIAEGGVVVERMCPESASLIEIVGARWTSDVLGARLADAPVLHLVETLLSNDTLRTLGTRRVDVSDPTSVVLIAEDELRILLGGLEGIVPRLDALVALCRTIDARDYESIDLRFGGEATLVPRKAVVR